MTDLDIACFLRYLFEKAGKRVCLYREYSCLTLKVYSKKLLLVVQSFVQYRRHHSRTLKVLVNELSWSRNFSLGFIGGLIDADGHVLKDKRRKGHFGAVITTSNPLLMRQLTSLFGQLGLKSKVAEVQPNGRSFSNNSTYYIRLGKEEFSKVCRVLICVKHKRVGCNTKHF